MALPSTFEETWRAIVARCPGMDIPRWTVHGRAREVPFKVKLVKSDRIIVHAPNAKKKAEISVPRDDFEFVYNLWPDYLNKSVSSHKLGKIFTQSYVISTLHWLDQQISEQSRSANQVVGGAIGHADDLHTEDHEFATESAIEGTKTEATYWRRHRDPRLRDNAFDQAEGVCCVCDTDFSKLLDGRGVRVLQVHHREQLSSLDSPKVNTVDDLAVVCANCHMLLHLDPKKTLKVEELRNLLV